MTVAEITVARVTRPRKSPSPKTWEGRVALRLKELREAAGLDMESAAAAITKAGYEVGASTLYRWEQAITQPHVSAWKAIAKAYKITTGKITPDE